ncbi:hypothetical protein [Rubinisphaera margarita]|uniref:hypothetical protein n=1 Tax=Rubinisphaera margarita TaxID=2909586 RepID=UPI001EE9095B|nr:hypothetical protein [Rubinisphaera margarita]MCG6155727.1 hypothetical protein [Rubinisphaera margarita]
MSKRLPRGKYLLIPAAILCAVSYYWYARIDAVSRLRDAGASVLSTRGVPGDGRFLTLEPAFYGVDIVFLHQANVDSSIVSALATLSEMKRISLNGTTIAGEEMTRILETHQLTDLIAEDSTLGDEFLAAVEKDSSLEVIALKGTRVTDVGITLLKHCPELQLLDLGKTAVTDEGLAALGHLALLDLRIQDTAVTDRGLDALKLAEIRGLDISRTAVSAAGEWPRRMPLLARLNVSFSDVPPGRIEQFVAHRQLEVLHVDASQVGQWLFELDEKVLPSQIEISGTTQQLADVGRLLVAAGRGMMLTNRQIQFDEL